MNEDAVNTLEKDELKRSSHPYWIWESIRSIPSMLTRCLEDENRSAIRAIVHACLERDIQRFLLLGRGSSYFLTIAGGPFLHLLTGLETAHELSNEFEAYNLDDIGPKTAVLFHSHSGKSAGDVEIAKKVHARSAYSIALTDFSDSPLAQTVDDIILGPGGSKVELPATRSYATTLFNLYLFALEYADALGRSIDPAYEAWLQKLPSLLGKKWENDEAICSGAARDYADRSSFIVLGFGPNYATADEAALSISQSAGVPAFSFALENFIHGPIQVIEPTQAVIFIAPPGTLQGRMLKTLQAVRTIGAKTILLAPEQQEDLPACDVRINLPSGLPDLLSPLAAMIPLWQFAYHLALLGRGGHPDRLAMDREEFQKAFQYLL